MLEKKHSLWKLLERKEKNFSKNQQLKEFWWMKLLQSLKRNMIYNFLILKYSQIMQM